MLSIIAKLGGSVAHAKADIQRLEPRAASGLSIRQRSAGKSIK